MQARRIGRSWDLILPRALTDLRLIAANAIEIKVSTRTSVMESGEFRGQVESAWARARRQARAEGGREPVDQLKYRLDNAWDRNESIVLEIGLTSYKHYIALREDSELAALVARASRRAGAPGRFFPSALGNVGAVVTTDEKIVAIRRSSAVSTYHGWADLPGGHPEPRPGRPRLPTPAEVRRELFSSVIREVRQDISVEANLLGEPKLVGILANKKDAWKPDMVFYIPLSLTAEELRIRFDSRLHPEVEELIPIPLPCETKGVPDSLTPIAQGALTMISGLFRRKEGLEL